MDRKAKIQEAINSFNANPPVDDFYGRKSPHHARLPVLATDCDYEIVSVSGVQGMRIGE